MFAVDKQLLKKAHFGHCQFKLQQTLYICEANNRNRKRCNYIDAFLRYTVSRVSQRWKHIVEATHRTSKIIFKAIFRAPRALKPAVRLKKVTEI